MTRTGTTQNAPSKTVSIRPNRPDAIAMLAAMAPSTSVATKSIAPPAMRTKTRQPKPGARAGTRQLAGHFPIGTCSAMKFLVAEEDTTMQALLEEAINDLLVKKGRTKLVHA